MTHLTCPSPSSRCCSKLEARMSRTLCIGVLYWIVCDVVFCSGFLLSPATLKSQTSATFRLAAASSVVDSPALHHNATETEELSFFQVLAGNVVHCLVKSELKRDSGFDGASTGWTSWVEDSSALRLQACMDKLSLTVPVSEKGALLCLLLRMNLISFQCHAARPSRSDRHNTPRRTRRTTTMDSMDQN